MIYKVGDKIKFKSEKCKYKIVGLTDRYLVCIKPFNLKHTYLYTIVDLVKKERGPDHWLMGKYDLRDPKSVQECLSDLKTGICQISNRGAIDLDLETV